jgi:hypothetical protein
MAVTHGFGIKEIILTVSSKLTDLRNDSGNSVVFLSSKCRVPTVKHLEFIIFSGSRDWRYGRLTTDKYQSHNTKFFS